MFVRHSADLNAPIATCTEAFLNGPPRWFLQLGKKNAGVVGVHVGGIEVRKRVKVELGEPVRTSTWTVIPLAWRATFPQQLFPVMTGRIEVAPVDKGITRITVSGRYQPPLGRLGKRLDEAVMHIVAEATVRELAESIAQRLNKAIASNNGLKQ